MGLQKPNSEHHPLSLGSHDEGKESCDENAPRYDRYGFMCNDRDEEQPLEYPMTETSVEEGRIRENTWVRIVKDWKEWKSIPGKQEKLRKHVEEGIPDSIRRRAWYLLSGAPDLGHKANSSVFNELRLLESSFDDQIRLDLPRTFPNHIMFMSGTLPSYTSTSCSGSSSGQQSLMDILRALSHLYPQVGYCQGMSFVAAVLLMRMPPEEAFRVFASMLERGLWRYYEPTMSGLLEAGDRIKFMLRSQMPDLAKHFNDRYIEPLAFATPWFVGLFTTHLSERCWPSVLRFFDTYFLQGEQSIFQTGLAILQLQKETLLSKDGLDELLPLLQRPTLSIIRPEVLFPASARLYYRVSQDLSRPLPVSPSLTTRSQRKRGGKRNYSSSSTSPSTSSSSSSPVHKRLVTKPRQQTSSESLTTPPTPPSESSLFDRFWDKVQSTFSTPLREAMNPPTATVSTSQVTPSRGDRTPQQQHQLQRKNTSSSSSSSSHSTSSSFVVKNFNLNHSPIKRAITPRNNLTATSTPNIQRRARNTSAPSPPPYVRLQPQGQGYQQTQSPVRILLSPPGRVVRSPSSLGLSNSTSSPVPLSRLSSPVHLSPLPLTPTSPSSPGGGSGKRQRRNRYRHRAGGSPSNFSPSSPSSVATNMFEALYRHSPVSGPGEEGDEEEDRFLLSLEETFSKLEPEEIQSGLNSFREFATPKRITSAIPHSPSTSPSASSLSYSRADYSNVSSPSSPSSWSGVVISTEKRLSNSVNRLGTGIPALNKGAGTKVSGSQTGQKTPQPPAPFSPSNNSNEFEDSEYNMVELTDFVVRQQLVETSSSLKKNELACRFNSTSRVGGGNRRGNITGISGLRV